LSSDEAARFFERLAPLDSFDDVVDPSRYAPAPPAWRIIVTDICDSTGAIKAGRYKDINVLGAASIACVVNACRAPRPPYVFGGDGAVLLVPADRMAQVQTALNRLCWRARDAFDLRMRAGAVPVGELTTRGFDVRVAKYSLSADVKLAMFAGSGIDEATRLVKDPASERVYSLVEEQRPASTDAPVQGLNCRWQPFDSRNGEIVAIIVRAIADDDDARTAAYRTTLAFMQKLFEAANVKPVAPETANLARAAADLDTEARLKTGQRSGVRHAARRTLIGLVNRIGASLIRNKRKLGSFDGASYPAALVANSDFRKFDGALRMVLDITPAQRATLDAHLEEGYRSGALVYGLSCSSRALLTCMVYDRKHDHVHFVDGADGGYAAAAQQLLERASALPGRRPGSHGK
jgi:hypothetical protein